MNIGLIFLLFGTFIGAVLLVSIGKKFYYRWFLKKRYFIIPRLSTTGICNVGIVLSLTITIIILLIITTAGLASTVFRLWAGTRIIFEGILIKIGGLMFGPIVGMAIGAATDLLTITYSGGIFHYGYFISAILFGLFGGLIRVMIRYSKNRNLKFTILSSISTIVIALSSSILIYVSNDSLSSNIFEMSLMGYEFKITLDTIVALVTTIPVCGVIVMWVVYAFYLLREKKKKNKNNWYISFAPIFILIIISEVIVNLIFMPVFDANISPLPYQSWLFIRLLLYVPMVIINLIVILPVYKVIKPLMKYRYEDDLIESLDQPIEINNREVVKI